MKHFATIVLFALASSVHAADVPALAFKLKGIDGKEVDLSQYKGKVVLFVNVASECGYTNQYAGLQKLYEQNKDKGLMVVGVPSNEFGGQEPGSDKQIAQFCEKNYKVTFPLLAKTTVNGEKANPLYKYLTSKESGVGGEVQWNFEKFLVGRDGMVVARFKSDVEPDDEAFVRAIKKALDR